MPAILLVPIVALAVVGVIMLLIRRGRAEYRRVAAELKAIGALPYEEARRRALTMLRDTRVFRCTEVTSRMGSAGAAHALPRGVQELFGQCSHVETTAGPMLRLERSLVSASHTHPGYTVIGKGMEGTDVEFDLAVRADGESVYELHGGEAPDPVFGTYTSVYHWILSAGGEARRGERSGRARR
jgi:hypothetical protein